MPGHAINGKYGDAWRDGVAFTEFTKWEFNPKSQNSGYVSSATNGFTKMTEGNNSATVTIEGKYRPDDPITMYFNKYNKRANVRLFTIKLPNLEAYYQMDILVSEGPKLSVNRENAEITGWSISADVDGEWIEPSPTPIVNM